MAPTNSSTYKKVRFTSIQHTSDLTNVMHTNGMGVYVENTTALTGMSFWQSGGNHESDIKVYGLKR